MLTASLANGKTQTVTEGYTCSPTKLSTVGTQTVTVTYKGKTATYAVSVVDTSVASLTITQKPTKLIYYRGTSLVTTGMERLVLAPVAVIPLVATSLPVTLLVWPIFTLPPSAETIFELVTP